MDLMEVWLLWHQLWHAFGYWMLQISKWYLLWRMKVVGSYHIYTPAYNLEWKSGNSPVVDESLHYAIFAEQLSGEVYKFILHELGTCSWGEMTFECSISRQFGASIWTHHTFGKNPRFQVSIASFLREKTFEIAKIGQLMSYAIKKALAGSCVHLRVGHRPTTIL